jgi:hypothetical protein
MGYSASIVHESQQSPWSVLVRVCLTRAESNDLFLSGDSIVSWPTEGLRPAEGEASMPERTGMFISEIAARPHGLVINYSDQAQAERAVGLLRAQFAKTGIKEET